MNEALLSLYEHWSGRSPLSVTPVSAGGSNRQYFRLIDSNGRSVIGTVGPNRDENTAFIYICRHFSAKRLPVPQILAVSDDGKIYLQTDLGNRTLFDALRGGREAGGRYTSHERQLLIRTITALPDIQIRGAHGLDWNYCYPQPVFDSDSVLFDLNYFKYCFLKATELEFHELKLEANFRMFAADLTSETGQSFLYRDFQARNVMLDANDQPYFIDFQGGRKGPFYYDVASFLWQASAKYPFKLRRDLIAVYYNALKNYIEIPSVHHFARRLSLFVLFRLLQVLGAYGFRGYFERKQHFIDSIPPAMRNLRDLLSLNPDIFPYPYMMDMLKRLVALPQFAPVQPKVSPRADGFRTTTSSVYPLHPEDGLPTYSKYDGHGPLVVRVFSFAFSKGIPPDDSGNGGGYVFDCRSTHNPGRYEPYKNLTGLDEPVIRFLEDDGEILIFLQNVYKLADHHVERYLQRGFTSLMFSFGCTGGQHRSVYCAQHLAQHIHEKYGIEVRVTHREQNIGQTLPAVKGHNDGSNDLSAGH